MVRIKNKSTFYKGLIINAKKIVFLDRDGVINYDHGYVYEIEKFDFIPGVFEACKNFLKMGYEIIIVTNQSGIGRKYYTEEKFQKLTLNMLNEFNKNEINILRVYHCPHAPEDKCNCRKPNTGMIEKACKDFLIDLSKSWLIGDKQSDIQTAINANIGNYILISSDKNDKEKINISENLLKASKVISLNEK